MDNLLAVLGGHRPVNLWAGADVKAAADNLLSAVMEAIDEVANRMSQSRVDENPAH